MPVDEDVLLRAARVVSAQLRRRVEQLLGPGDDVGRGVPASPDGHACAGARPDACAQTLGRLRRARLRNAREHDGEPAVVEPRDEVELACGADEPAKRLVLMAPRDAHQHERERLVVLPCRGRESAELVVQVRLVVDAGERIAPSRLAGGREQQQPAADEQQGGDDEHEHDRPRGRLAASALDDEDEQDHEQRAGHADRGPDPHRRTALGPVRPAPDCEGGGDRRQTDQTGLELPAEIDEPARDVAVGENEVRVDAVGDPAGRDARRDEPPRERAAPRRDERRRRNRAEQDEVEDRVAEPRQARPCRSRAGDPGARATTRAARGWRRPAARRGAPGRRSGAATAERTRPARRRSRRRSRSSRHRSTTGTAPRRL